MLNGFQETPKESTIWDDLAQLGYTNGQFFFPGMNTEHTPLTFDLLRKRYHLHTGWPLLSISGDMSGESHSQENSTPCHRKVVIMSRNKDGEHITLKGHIKSVPILDIIGMMKGTYVPTGMDACLPSRALENSKTANKVSNPNNQGYVDCITGYALSRLVESNKCPGFSKCYGHFTSIAPSLRVDITDDFYSIRNMAWFHRGMGSRFMLEVVEYEDNGGSKSGKKSRKITIGDEIFGFTEDMKDIAETPEVISEELKNRTPRNDRSHATLHNDMEEIVVLPGLEPVTTDPSGDEFVSDEEDATDDESDDDEDSDDDEPSEEERESIGDDESDEDEDSDEGEDSDEDEEETGKFYAMIPNMPIQSSIYENLEGPIDILLGDSNITEDHWRSILFQVVFSLAVAQKEMRFVHNDLHTNNIMWVPTDQPYLWYRIDGNVYKVPTYGKIVKIIDFGRSFIYYAGREYLSDAFDFKNDAGGQYNYPPYYQKERPLVPPNPSFDLPR